MLLPCRVILRLRIGSSPKRGLLLAFLSLLVGATVVVASIDSTFAQEGRTLYLPLARSGPQSSIIPNQYIVLLQDASVTGDTPRAISAADAANALVAQYGGSVLYTYDTALYGFAATLSPESAAAIQADPAVALVEPDQIVQVSQDVPDVTQQGATWGLDRIDQRALPLDQRYNYTTQGLTVHVYVIDTGVRATHSEFGGRVSGGFTVINDGQGTGDCNGHGTHVAGTIGGATYGVAKRVTIHPVRVLNCAGSGAYSGVIAGLEWVAAHRIKPAVANMSLGGTKSVAVNDAVKNAISKGVVFVVAAGNESSDACNVSPASVNEAITVGATTNTDSRSSFSNFGKCLDIFAPGTSILSTWQTSNSATKTLSGTSMASPHVAGTAALYLQANPLATPAQVANAFVNAATPNRVTSPGTGSPNRLLYTIGVQPGGTTLPPAPPPPPNPSSCTEVAANGNFELDASVWTQSSTQGFMLLCTKATCGAGLQPHSGATLAWLGGGNNERSRISQTLTIPADKPAYLSFWHWIESEDYCGYDYGYVQVFANNSLRTIQRDSLCNSTSTGGWKIQAIDLSSFAGQTVRVEFYVANDRSLISNLLIDDVSLRSGASCSTSASAEMMPASIDAPLDELFSDPPEIIRGEETPAGDAIWRR